MTGDLTIDVGEPEPDRDPERLLVAAYDALRILGREVRALRERLAGEAL